MTSKLAIYELHDGQPAKCVFEDVGEADESMISSDEIISGANRTLPETQRGVSSCEPMSQSGENLPRPESGQEHGKDTIVQELKECIGPFSRDKASKDQPVRRVCLLEGTHSTVQLPNSQVAHETTHELCPDSCKACLLKKHLGAPESLFTDHKKQSVTFSFNEDVRFPQLPTHRKPDQTFQLHYFDLREFIGDPALITFECPLTRRRLCPGSDGALNLNCAETGCEIQCHEWQNRFEPESKRRGTLFIVPRKCSFWIKKHRNGGFDAIIIVDPPVSRASVGPYKLNLTPNKPFQSLDHFGGYIPLDLAWDFSSETLRDGPPQDGMFKDLRYCFDHFSPVLNVQDGSLAASLFLKKIIASHYIPLIAFVSHQICSMRGRGWALQRDTDQQREEARMVENDWSRFRCSEYIEAMMDNLFALAIPRAKTDILVTNDWRATAEEFQWIYQRLFECRASYLDLTSSMAALAGIVSNDRTAIGTSLVSRETSILSQDARATKIVTFVALVFAPLALIASFFSMGPVYGPGGPKFGVYFAVSLPLTVLVLCVSLFSIGGFSDKLDSLNIFQSVYRHMERIVSPRREKISSADVPPDAELSVRLPRSRPDSVVNDSIYQSSLATHATNPQILRPRTPIPQQSI